MNFKVQAHRGASGYAPENTLPAFQLACDMGADGIECDIHLSRDGEFMVCHDETVDRTSNGSGRIADQTAAELKKLDFGSWYGADFAGTTIPTLSEMLDVVAGLDIINIEVKSFGDAPAAAIDRLYDLLTGRGLMKKVIISSFNIELLKQMKKRHSEFYTAYLYSGKLKEGVTLAAAHLCDAIHPAMGDTTAEVVAFAREKGLAINTWTLNSAKDIARIGKLDITGIITNYPDVAIKVREEN